MIPTVQCLLEGFPAQLVVEPALSDILKCIKELVRGLSPHGKFPGPNPCSLERRDLQGGIQRSWLCEKTDGVRALLVFLTYRGTKKVFLVTRAWKVYVLSLHVAPKVLFQGTAFDGELVFFDGRWTWLGFDAMVVSGIPVWSLLLSERLQAARRGLSAYKETDKDSLVLRFKEYYKSFDDYRASLLTSSIPNDGTVITPEDLPVVLGRHATLYKLKDSGKHTVDFQFVPPDMLCVYDPSHRVSVSVATLRLDHVPSLSIVEAEFVAGKWKLVTVRSDKTTSNDVLTYEKTMINIKENLTLDDLQASWKPWG